LRRFWRDSGWKVSEFCRFVIKRVFVGLDGWVRGGRLDRSSLRLEPREDDRDLFVGLAGSERLEVEVKVGAVGLCVGLSIIVMCGG